MRGFCLFFIFLGAFSLCHDGFVQVEGKDEGSEQKMLNEKAETAASTICVGIIGSNFRFGWLE